MTRLSVTIAFLISFLNQAYSQDLPFKFGKVNKNDFSKTICDFHPSAKSMVEGESAFIYFHYDNTDGWKYRMEVEVRKRIFDISDADEANIDILIYDPVNSNSSEEIKSLKGFSYNLESGKVQKEKVRNKEFFETRINDYWVKYSFAIPNVKKGTIVEYSYEKESDYIYNLATWEFQGEIPKAFSKLKVLIPEYFNYQFSQVGNFIELNREGNKRQESFTYSWETLPQRGGKVERGTGTLNSNSTLTTFFAEDIAPVIEEPYINNKVDMPARMEFQLISTLFPNSTMKVVAGNYTKFNNELIESSFFGDKYLKGSNVKDITSDKIDLLEKSVDLYNQVVNHFIWNGTINFTSSDAGRKAWKEQSGTVADINLTLLGIFRENNIEAYPIILSLRGKGIPHPVYPSYQDFNYIVIAVKIDDNFYFCDATSDSPFGQLPLKCRNGNGFIVKQNGGQWINLKSGSSFTKSTVLEFKFYENQLQTSVKQKLTDYAALQDYSNIQENGMETYKNSFHNKFSDYSVDSLKISDIDKTQPLNIEFELVQKENGLKQTYYLQPILLGTILDSPFNAEKRFSSIDFPYQQSYNVYSRINIPDGYSAELPEPVMLKLPNNDASFLFNLSQNGNTVSVISKLSFDKTDYTAAEYPNLKAFMEKVVEKNNELIILSKE